MLSTPASNARWRCLLFGLAAAICAGTVLAPPSGGQKHETWVEVRSPNFIVVSNAGEKEARKTAIRFEQIRTLYRKSLAIASQHSGPATTILAVKDENSMKALLPDFFVKGHTRPAGLYAAGWYHSYMAVDLASPGSNPFAPIYHEYYHSVTLPYFPGLPLWLAEGLADFYGYTDITDREALMGRPSPELIAQLRINKMIPLDVLFKVDHSSPYYNEESKSNVFYAESWALTHYFLVGDNQAHRALLSNFLAAMDQGSSANEAAAKAFGDLKQLQSALERYIHGYNFYEVKTAAPEKIAESELHARILSDAETDAYRGGFEVVRGHRDLGEPLLKAAIELDPKVALAYEYMALSRLFAGDREQALDSISKAIAAEPHNALTRYLRAWLATSGRGMGKHDAQTEEDLRAAIAANPDFAPAYDLLGIYLASKGDNFTEALSVARNAVLLEPANSRFRLDVARVLVGMERYDEAQTLAKQALSQAIEPVDKSNAQSFLQTLQSLRESSAAAARQSAPPSPPAPQTTQTSGNDSATPDLTSATGTVTQLSCARNLEIELKTATVVLHLHDQPGVHVKFLMTSPPAGFDLCKSLKDKRVTVQFKPDDKKGKSNTIYTLRIYAPGEAELPDAPRKPAAPVLTPTPQEREHPTVTTEDEGTVKSVSCTGNEMKLVFLVHDVEFTLRARDFTRVSIEEDVPFETKKFDPCAQLSGHDAKITFVIVEGKAYDGDIQSIEVLK